MKWLAVAALVSFPALAQVDAGTVKPPTVKVTVAPPARPKALGSAKEDDDEPVTVSMKSSLLPGATGGSTDADAGLLRAMLYAFEPAPTEIRVIAIEDLGILGDPRALNPLAQLVMDPNQAVQMAALRAIAAIQHPRAEAILSNIVRHPAIGERVKLSAIDALVFQNSNSSKAFLSFLSRGSNFHPLLKQQADRVMRENFPEKTL